MMEIDCCHDGEILLEFPDIRIRLSFDEQRQILLTILENAVEKDLGLFNSDELLAISNNTWVLLERLGHHV